MQKNTQKGGPVCIDANAVCLPIRTYRPL